MELDVEPAGVEQDRAGCDILCVCSLQEWSKAELEWSREELGGASEGLHHKVEAEKVRREHMLDIRQVLAREVMQKSREVAGTCQWRHLWYSWVMFSVNGVRRMSLLGTA